jgi:hypothetical protein
MLIGMGFHETYFPAQVAASPNRVLQQCSIPFKTLQEKQQKDAELLFTMVIFPLILKTLAHTRVK